MAHHTPKTKMLKRMKQRQRKRKLKEGKFGTVIPTKKPKVKDVEVYNPKTGKSKMIYKPNNN